MTPLILTHQWLPVLLVPRPDGRTDKIPVDHVTGFPCDAHAPAAWTTYERAMHCARAWGQQYTVGFVLTEQDPFFCLDIDHAATPQGWSPLAQQLVAALPGCMIEVSQSGQGLHVWGRYLSPPPHRKKRVDLGIELYTERRFIAIGHSQVGEIAPVCATLPALIAQVFPPIATGASTAETGPCPEWRGPVDDEDLLRRAMQSRSAGSMFGEKATFADLWHADVDVLARNYPADANSTEPYDRSSADAALAAHLAFWTGRDVARIERLMRRSALRRDKWDQREDYLVERTIRGACGRQTQVLQDKPVEPVGTPGATVAPPATLQPAVGPVAAPPALVAPSGGARLVEGNTFLTPAQQIEHFAGCTYVQDHHRVLVPGGQLLKPDAFKARYGGYTYIMDNRNERTTRNAWEAFTESQAVRFPRADGVCFKPQLPFGAIVDLGGVSLANTYSMPNVAMRAGDATPFWIHLALMFPDEAERRFLFYWMCAAVQRQGYKAQWSPVIQGVEGNGKSLLGKFLAHAIGKKYVHWPRADKIGNGFNAWVMNATLFIVDEIKTDNREDLLEVLKPMITADEGIEVEKKGVDQITAEICGNFMFLTNYRNALKKTLNDRRFMVLYCAQQTKADVDRDMPGQYMNDFHAWTKNGGFEIVAHLLWTTPIPPEFDFSKQLQRAPVTRSTAAAVAESMGAVEQELLEAVEREEQGFRGGWISSGGVDRVLRTMNRTIAHSKRRELLQSIGYDWHPHLPEGRVHNLVLPDAAKVKLFVRRDAAELLALSSAAEIARAYSAAQGVAAPGR